MPVRKKVRDLRLFLLREDVVDPREAFREGVRLDEPPLREDLPFEAHLFLRSGLRRPPWADFLEDGARESLGIVPARQFSAVLVLRTAGRLFAFTFGYGRSILRLDRLEPSFGLKVALNAVDPARLRSVDAHTVEELTIHTRRQVSRGSAIDVFGLDVSRDLLRAVTGDPSDQELARRLTGADALQFVSRIEFRDLGAKVATLLDVYGRDDYKAHFAWVDHLREVRDPEILRDLDQRLVAALTGPRHAQPHLAPPEPIDWLEAGWFGYSTEPPGEQHEDLDLDDYLLTLDDPASVGVARLHADRVEVHSSQDDHSWERWSVYECLVYETETGGDLYVLTRGLWFRVASDFVADVRTRLGRIGSATITLPDASPHEWEEHYNRRVGEMGLAICMDRRLASPGGTTDRLEFCDLLTPGRHLIHVKKWSSSATLSHLFAQGVVSAETFLRDASFRQAIRERIRQLDEALVAVIPEERPDATEYEIVYAVIGKPEVMALPFFSQLALVQASERASAYGFRVGTVFAGEAETG